MSVRFSSPTNSTVFTMCCGTAICSDQDMCSSCGKEIPGTQTERFNAAMLRWYGKEKLAQMNAEADRKWSKANRGE